MKQVFGFIVFVFLFGFLGLNTSAQAQTTLTPERGSGPLPERIIDFVGPSAKDPVAPYQILENVGEDKETTGNHREFEIRFAQKLDFKNSTGLKEAAQEIEREGINLLGITSQGALLAIKPDAVDCFILQQAKSAAAILNRVLSKGHKLVLEVAVGRDPDGKNYQLECVRAF